MAEQTLFCSGTLALLTLVQGWRQSVTAGVIATPLLSPVKRRPREITYPCGLTFLGFFHLDLLVCGTASPAFQVGHLAVASPIQRHPGLGLAGLHVSHSMKMTVKSDCHSW